MISMIFIMLTLNLNANAKTLRIAVIDTGLDTSSTVRLCNDVIHPFDSSPISHGTAVVDLIKSNAGNTDYCIYPIKVFTPKFNPKLYFKGLKIVRDGHFDILNLSLGGYKYSKAETRLISQILDKGVIIFAASGNENKNLDENCSYFPACADPRVVIVGSTDRPSGHGKVVKLKNSDYTSYATAKETGRLINFISKHEN